MSHIKRSFIVRFGTRTTASLFSLYALYILFRLDSNRFNRLATRTWTIHCLVTLSVCLCIVIHHWLLLINWVISALIGPLDLYASSCTVHCIVRVRVYGSVQKQSELAIVYEYKYTVLVKKGATVTVSYIIAERKGGHLQQTLLVTGSVDCGTKVIKAKASEAHDQLLELVGSTRYRRVDSCRVSESSKLRTRNVRVWTESVSYTRAIERQQCCINGPTDHNDWCVCVCSHMNSAVLLCAPAAACAQSSESTWFLGVLLYSWRCGRVGCEMKSRGSASVAHDGREVREAAAELVRGHLRRLPRAHAHARPSPSAHRVPVEVGRADAVRLARRAAAHAALAGELRLDRRVRDANQQRQHLCTEQYPWW